MSPLSAQAWLDAPVPPSLGVEGARLVRMQALQEARGLLTVGEVERHIPFPPRRYFVISGVPDENIRGEHAHLAQHHYSRDAILLVLASHEYDPADYVRDYARFAELARAPR